MRPSLLLSTLFVLSATARPLGPSPIDPTPREPRLTPSLAHTQPRRPHLALAGRRLPSSSVGSEPLHRVTHQISRRFIMDADYASRSGPPGLWSKSSHKRASPPDLPGMLGTTELGYQDLHEEFPPTLPATSTPA
ncbi:hypothetical protein BC827DRAFT_1203559 [Russula dissimulans]|nr:hypothetical protein BC827DRAFT_1203559 [Russula dissimulans]